MNNEVLVESWVVSGDLEVLWIGFVVDFLAPYYAQLLVVDLSVLDTAGV